MQSNTHVYPHVKTVLITKGCTLFKFSLYPPECTHNTNPEMYISHSKLPLFNMTYYSVYHSYSATVPFPLYVEQHGAVIATERARPFERLDHDENESHLMGIRARTLQEGLIDRS